MKTARPLPPAENVKPVPEKPPPSKLVRTASITGAFVSGGGDPAAELAGNFTVTGTSYDAAGIIAAAK